ncbi:unnamed protein product [Rotaria sp. Silwood2]|nr:unnamed protein product [Rotaria sp. Silwood2]
MAHTGGDSFVKDSVITDDDEPMIVGDDRRVMVDNNDSTIIRSKNKVLIPINNEPVLVDTGVHGTIITVNRVKHYAFLKRNDKNQYKDIFAREASIINQSYQRKFFLSDKCKFDVIKTIKENNEQLMEMLKDVFKSTIAELFIEASKKNK